MRLLIIRHAQPEPASAALPDGERPLDATGRRQAACLAEALRTQGLDCVVSSPMRRAMETAEPAAHVLSVPLVVAPELAEIALGDLSAWGPREQAEWEKVTSRWGQGELSACCPGGESLADVVERVEPAVSRLLGGLYQHGLAVVAHAVVNGVILSLVCPELRGTLGRAVGHSLAGIWELEGGGRAFRVLRSNDTQHLPQWHEVDGAFR